MNQQANQIEIEDWQQEGKKRIRERSADISRPRYDIGHQQKEQEFCATSANDLKEKLHWYIYLLFTKT